MALSRGRSGGRRLQREATRNDELPIADGQRRDL